MLFLKNTMFTLIVPGTVAVYVPLMIARDRPAGSGAAFVAGLVLLAGGGAMYSWCVWHFARFGRGTPAPVDAPKTLVIRGPYRYCRNPMYIGVLTAICGWSALYGSTTLLVYALCVGLGFHLFIVLYEEPYLRREFGEQYTEYTTRVGRWLPRPHARIPLE